MSLTNREKNDRARDDVVDLFRAQGYTVAEDHPIQVILSGGTKIDVRVHSKWSNGNGWWVRENEVNEPREDLFFAFITYVDPENEAHLYIVPSAVVLNAVTARENTWLAGDSNRIGTEGMYRFSPNTDTQLIPHVPGFPAGWLDHYENAWVTMDLVEHAAR